MSFPRASGILLHPTSLASRGGIGDFGPSAYAFADFLASARQGLWQVLPLGPLGYGNSPYSRRFRRAKRGRWDRRLWSVGVCLRGFSSLRAAGFVAGVASGPARRTK